jgi:preprotein translocase subunit SecG
MVKLVNVINKFSMDLVTVFKFVCAGAASAIVISVLLQARSGGLGSVFGGVGGEAYRSKRGVEALMYNVTIVSGVIFALSAIAIAVLSA